MKVMNAIIIILNSGSTSCNIFQSFCSFLCASGPVNQTKAKGPKERENVEIGYHKIGYY